MTNQLVEHHHGSPVSCSSWLRSVRHGNDGWPRATTEYRNFGSFFGVSLMFFATDTAGVLTTATQLLSDASWLNVFQESQLNHK